jgi:Fe-S-cluster-containing hydrogenase component 2
MAKQLVVNLDICRDCPQCVITCSYPHHQYGGNCGIAWLREVAQYDLTCRRCEERACIEACPVEALDELEDGRLVRYNMRCIGCQSCAHACYFGTIAFGALQFRDTGCDLCEGRIVEAPTCVPTCPYGALAYQDVAVETDPLLHQIEQPPFVVRTARFQKTEPEATPSPSLTGPAGKK